MLFSIDSYAAYQRDMKDLDTSTTSPDLLSPTHPSAHHTGPRQLNAVFLPPLKAPTIPSILLYIPNPAVANAPTATTRLNNFTYHRPARKPRSQRLAPESERVVRHVAGSKPEVALVVIVVAAPAAASRWIAKPSMRRGGKVYVNCIMQRAATKPERALREGGC
jgi:hypothetical protein